MKYFLKWTGYSSRFNSWVKESDMKCPDLIARFEDSLEIIGVKMGTTDFFVKYKGDNQKNLTEKSFDDLMKSHPTKLQQFLKHRFTISDEPNKREFRNLLWDFYTNNNNWLFNRSIGIISMIHKIFF